MLRHTPREAHDLLVHVSPRSGRRYAIRVATLADRDALADVYLTCPRHTFTWVDPSLDHRTVFIEDKGGVPDDAPSTDEAPAAEAPAADSTDAEAPAAEADTDTPDAAPPAAPDTTDAADDAAPAADAADSAPEAN